MKMVGFYDLPDGRAAYEGIETELEPTEDLSARARADIRLSLRARVEGAGFVFDPEAVKFTDWT